MAQAADGALPQKRLIWIKPWHSAFA